MKKILIILIAGLIFQQDSHSQSLNISKCDELLSKAKVLEKKMRLIRSTYPLQTANSSDLEKMNQAFLDVISFYDEVILNCTSGKKIDAVYFISEVYMNKSKINAAFKKEEPDYQESIDFLLNFLKTNKLEEYEISNIYNKVAVYYRLVNNSKMESFYEEKGKYHDAIFKEKAAESFNKALSESAAELEKANAERLERDAKFKIAEAERLERDAKRVKENQIAQKTPQDNSNSVRTPNERIRSNENFNYGTYNLIGSDFDGSYSLRKMKYTFYKDGRVSMEQTETVSDNYSSGRFTVNGETININWNSGTSQIMNIYNRNTILFPNANAIKLVYSGY